MHGAAQPEQVLKQHGKTFAYAQRFLGKDRGHAVARLYHFCRYIDDLADESGDPANASQALHGVRHDLAQYYSQQPIVQDFLDLAQTWHIDTHHGDELVHGVLLDLQQVRIENEAELLRYCYYVAGTVGLMMCPLLGADPAGAPFAVDLGIAMQLTNIARDVHYDAGQGRRYLPGSWVGNRSAETIYLARETDRTPIKQAIQRLLDMAETYYTSGTAGFVHLPLRSRISIAIAAHTYREIGCKLLRNGCPWWQGRIYTTTTEKTRLAALTALSQLMPPYCRPEPHNSHLHHHIATLTSPRSGGE